MLEIWPAGHFSPIHSHANAEAIIKVLHGGYSSAPLSLPLKPLQWSNLLGVVWISPNLNQIHQLMNQGSRLHVDPVLSMNRIPTWDFLISKIWCALSGKIETECHLRVSSSRGKMLPNMPVSIQLLIKKLSYELNYRDVMAQLSRMSDCKKAANYFTHQDSFCQDCGAWPRAALHRQSAFDPLRVSAPDCIRHEPLQEPRHTYSYFVRLLS